MTVGGVILSLLGAISIIYGVSINNDVEARLEYLFSYGKRNPGNTWIIIGAILAVIGVLMIIAGILRKNKASAEEETKEQPVPPNRTAEVKTENPPVSHAAEVKTENPPVSHAAETKTAEKPVSRVKSRGFSVPDDLD